MSAYKTVAELLEDPARWAKCPGKTTECVGTAIGYVYVTQEAIADAKLKFLAAAGLPTDGDFMDKSLRIFEWNDAPERTHAEVLDAVRRAQI